MSELAEIYRKYTGNLHLNIDELINRTPKDKLPSLYKRLTWNLGRGMYIKDIHSRKAKDFAYIICNLAVKCGLDENSEDIIPDGYIGFSDWLAKKDLTFAHQIISDCEHIEKVIRYLMIDSENNEYLLNENNDKIILDV